MGSPIRSGFSPIQNFHAVAQDSSGDEKGKEEADSDVDLQSEPLPLMHQLRSGSPARVSDDDEYLSEVEGEEEEDVDLQSEPLPLTHQFSIHQMPPEILTHILYFVAGSDLPGDAKNLYTIQLVCHLWKEVSASVFKMYWNSHCDNPEASLYPFTHAIEGRIRVIEEKVRGFKFSYFFRFQELTRDFGRMGIPIPNKDSKTAFQPPLGLQPLQYVQAYQGLLDASLAKIAPKVIEQTTYFPGAPTFFESKEAFLQALEDPAQAAAFAEIEPRILEQIYAPGDSVLIGAKAFRQWLNHPANADRISQITNLKLSALGLSVLPPEIGKFPQLELLKLKNNRLTSLPDTFGNLNQLLCLCLENNEFANFPDVIVKLTQLQRLIFHDNKLTSLPNTVGELALLDKLTLDNNLLASLPPEIGKLTQLVQFSFSGNQLANLPLEISNLTQLQYLMVYDNPLLFILNRELSEAQDTFLNVENFLAKHLACLNYSCQSSLAALCQGIHPGLTGLRPFGTFPRLSLLRRSS